MKTLLFCAVALTALMLTAHSASADVVYANEQTTAGANMTLNMQTTRATYYSGSPGVLRIIVSGSFSPPPRSSTMSGVSVGVVDESTNAVTFLTITGGPSYSSSGNTTTFTDAKAAWTGAPYATGGTCQIAARVAGQYSPSGTPQMAPWHAMDVQQFGVN